jgi:hypothetical protein
LLINESDIEVELEDDAVVSQRRYRFTFDEKADDKDDDISDYVKFRLWLARQLAMRKFAQTWS